MPALHEAKILSVVFPQCYSIPGTWHAKRYHADADDDIILSFLILEIKAYSYRQGKVWGIFLHVNDFKHGLFQSLNLEGYYKPGKTKDASSKVQLKQQLQQINVEVPSPFKSKQSVFSKAYSQKNQCFTVILKSKMCFIIATLNFKNTTPLHLIYYKILINF